MLKQKHNRRLYFILSLLLMMVFSAKTPAQADSLSNPRITSTGAVVWDLVCFGACYQSSSMTVEPIQWRILQVIDISRNELL